MPRVGVTAEQVALVAELILAEGRKPTNRTVRERLGNTGSYETIRKHLGAWQEGRSERALATFELPQSIAYAISSEINKAIISARAEFQARLDQSQVEIAELTKECDSLRGCADDLDERVVALTQERDTLSGKASQLSMDVTRAREQIELEQNAAESARAKAAVAEHKVETLVVRQQEQTVELSEVRTALSKAQAGEADAKQQAAVLASRLDDANNRISRAQSIVEHFESERDKSALAIEASRAAFASELKQLQSERDAAIKLASDAREQAARLSGRLELLKERDAADD
jgi:chromosome segregation ATPase